MALGSWRQGTVERSGRFARLCLCANGAGGASILIGIEEWDFWLCLSTNDFVPTILLVAAATMSLVKALSILVFLASLCLAALVLWFTVESVGCMWSGNGFGAAILMRMGIPSAGISLLAVVVPSAVLYSYRRTWVERASLWTSATSALLAICELLALRFLPIHWHGF